MRIKRGAESCFTREKFKGKIMIRAFVAAGVLLCLSVSTLAKSSSGPDRESWESEDYWGEADINFGRFILPNITNERCSEKPKYLIACMDALATGLEKIDKDGLKLVRYQPELVGQARAEFYPFTVETYSSKDELKYEREKKAYYKKLHKELTGPDMSAVNVRPLLKRVVISLTRETKSFVAAEMYNALVALAHDPHTYIISKAEFEKKSKSSVKTKGVGIDLQMIDEGLLIVNVFDKSPAELAGLLAGDIITSVNGKNNNLIEVLGETGLKLDLVVSREDKAMELSLEKDFFTVNNVTVRVEKFAHENYLYIGLKHFMDDTLCREIKAQSKAQMDENKIDGVVLDLRNNAGGRVDLAMCLMGLFLEPGSISWSRESLRKAPGTLSVWYHKNNDNIFGALHTVTLINPRSASASEATSMYLKEYRKTFVVGERSFGKGTMQKIMGDGYNSKVFHARTSAKYYGPKGVSPQLIGVTPDFEVFPKRSQKEASKARREEDLFVFPISNHLPRDYDDVDRKAELELLKNCMDNDKTEEENYVKLEGFPKRSYDNQLAKAKEVLRCANKNIQIYKNINLDNLSEMKVVSNGAK